MATPFNLTLSEFSVAETSVGIAFIVYNVLFLLSCIICFGKLAPCATVYHCCIAKCSSSRIKNTKLMKKSRKTQLLVAVLLQIFTCYILFRALESIQDSINYALIFTILSFLDSINWFVARNIIELFGYYVFFALYTLFVAIFLKSGLVWIRNRYTKITIFILCNLVLIVMLIAQLLLTTICAALCIFYFDAYLNSVSYGFAPGLLLCIVILTCISFVVSTALIVILIKSNNSKAKLSSHKHKIEQQILIFKLIVASIFFFLANFVWIVGAVFYAFNLYYYIILLIRVIPDTLIVMGIFFVFWPFRLLPTCCFAPKHQTKQSKVSQFIQQVADSYDLVDEYDTPTDTSVATATAENSQTQVLDTIEDVGSRLPGEQKHTPQDCSAKDATTFTV